MGLESAPLMAVFLPKVLIVDDDPFNIEILQCMIESKGVAVDAASSGQGAIDLVLNRSEQVYHGVDNMYRLVIVDFNMPIMVGPQVVSRIREVIQRNLLLEEEASMPYFCCATAYPDDAVSQECNAAGINEIVQKPLPLDTIERLLSRVGLLE